MWKHWNCNVQIVFVNQRCSKRLYVITRMPAECLWFVRFKLCIELIVRVKVTVFIFCCISVLSKPWKKASNKVLDALLCLWPTCILTDAILCNCKRLLAVTNLYFVRKGSLPEIVVLMWKILVKPLYNKVGKISNLLRYIKTLLNWNSACFAKYCRRIYFYTESAPRMSEW